MKKNTSCILAAAALLGSPSSHLSANAAEVEVRRAISTSDAQAVTNAAAATTDIRQARGADNTAAATTDVRQARGADDSASSADSRRGRGADDSASSADSRRGRGADHAATAAGASRGHGADDVIATSSGALIPTTSALTAPAQSAPQMNGQEDKVSFGAAQQAAQTSGLVPEAVHRNQGGQHILDVRVNGFEKLPGTATADLENGEIIGNLPKKQRLRFALYANAEQAQAAATLWGTPAANDKRADGAVAAAVTGIITWEDSSSAPDASGSQPKGSINGLFLHSGRMPDLSAEYLRGKVIQIYGPLVTAPDASGNPLSYSRQVYWASEPIR